ncbi:MAG: hypothetical protein L6R38_002916 [Xanthoria sp. 2 TBL-2021]|nr:MAG: hypothetical protein L6R38_002916 [Xanthoria sp. 2 TBL-2021]
MTSRPPPSRAPSGTAANPVRRNLFHNHHLIRRPTGATAAAAAAAAGAAGATTAPNVSSSSSTMSEVNRYDDSSDIIMRDHNGDPQFQMPQVSLPMDDEQNGGNGGGNEEERERLEERILETYKSRNLVPELLSAVQASLRRKVTALAEDNWMYEAETTRPG